MVTLQFDLPEGSRTITCESGDILRDVMLTEKVRTQPRHAAEPSPAGFLQGLQEVAFDS